MPLGNLRDSTAKNGHSGLITGIYVCSNVCTRAFLMLALSTTDVLRFAVPYTAALRIRLWCRAALRPPKHRRLNYFGSVWIAVTDLD